MKNYLQFIKENYKLIQLENLKSVDWYLKYIWDNPTNFTTLDKIIKQGISNGYESEDILKIHNTFLELSNNNDFTVKYFKTLFL
jgi:hypothetical protein